MVVLAILVVIDRKLLHDSKIGPFTFLLHSKLIFESTEQNCVER